MVNVPFPGVGLIPPVSEPSRIPWCANRDNGEGSFLLCFGMTIQGSRGDTGFGAPAKIPITLALVFAFTSSSDVCCPRFAVSVEEGCAECVLVIARPAIPPLWNSTFMVVVEADKAGLNFGTILGIGLCDVDLRNPGWVEEFEDEGVGFSSAPWKSFTIGAIHPPAPPAFSFSARPFEGFIAASLIFCARDGSKITSLRVVLSIPSSLNASLRRLKSARRSFRVHMVMILSSSSNDRKLDRRSVASATMELTVDFERWLTSPARCCLFSLLVKVKASERTNRCSNAEARSKTDERTEGTESVAEEDSDLISAVRVLSKVANGEGVSGDLEYGFGSVCTPRDRVSRSNGRLFEGVVGPFSPSNSNRSRDGVAIASTCVVLPQGSGEVGVQGS